MSKKISRRGAKGSLSLLATPIKDSKVAEALSLSLARRNSKTVSTNLWKEYKELMKLKNQRITKNFTRQKEMVREL